MKRTIAAIITVATIFWVSNATGADTSGLIDMRGKLYEESDAIKPLLTSSKDPVLISSLWDSCIIAMSQLDAYFYMVGIVNSIKQEQVTEEQLGYLTKWLNEIKKTNQVNINSLNGISISLSADTTFRIEKLKGYFQELNGKIDIELARLYKVKESAKGVK